MASKTTPAAPAPNVPHALAEMEKARARGRGRRSPLYVWLRDNHDQLVEGFTRTAPAWATLAGYLGENGVRDGDGKIPSVRATREAWYRVRRELAANKARRSESKPATGVRPVPFASAPVGTPSVQVNAAEDDDAPLAAEPEFRVATPRWTPPPSKPAEASKPAPVPLRRDPDEAIARLLGRPKHNSMPMPAVPEPEDE